jgi:hypothetical protein
MLFSSIWIAKNLHYGLIKFSQEIPAFGRYRQYSLLKQIGKTVSQHIPLILIATSRLRIGYATL